MRDGPGTAKPVALYSACPPYRGADPETYLRHVRDISRWSEAAGCEGMLVYSDNGLLDPWLVAQVVVQATRTLSPLVAVQPVYMHPYTVAKMVTTLSYLHGRRIDLNMVAGGFRNDLRALDDRAEHDERYERLIEHTTIVHRLLSGGDTVTIVGRFYRVTNLRLTPPLDARLMPRTLVSGSSGAGLGAVKATGALSVRYPAPGALTELAQDPGRSAFGIRVGIITRPDDREAWAVARERFPQDRRGQIMHRLAMKVSDSSWHHELSRVADRRGAPDTYWMAPFRNYETFCPYLVGSYARIAEELARYLAKGCSTIILDVPVGEEDLGHITRVVGAASQVAAGIGRVRADGRDLDR